MFIIQTYLLLYSSLVCHGYISTLNESEYFRMPPLFSLDPYEACLHQHSGIYCSVKFHLVSDQPSELMTLIQEYSARTNTHFNHSQLQYGICLTKTCRKYYEKKSTVDQNEILEACLNETFWRIYGLKTKIIPDEVTCEKFKENIVLDTSDLVVGLILVLILMLNVVGSLQEFCASDKSKNDNFVNKSLACFSIQQNWKRLTVPAGEGLESRLRALRGLSGIRAILLTLIITCHFGSVTYTRNSDNPRHFEESLKYHSLIFMFANGTLLMQSFFVISAFLIAYNLQLYQEKHTISWILFPKAIVHRWLRLTPPYAVVLAVSCTWLRHAGTGPLWPIVQQEINDCRRDWWLHLLYVNNYVDNSHCLITTWSMAADFQLYIIGLIIFIFLDAGRRKVMISLLLAAGVIIPAAHTYFQDLDAVLMGSPEVCRNLFIKDPFYNHSYKRGHTNLFGFAIGFFLGFLIYHWQKIEFEFPDYVKRSRVHLLTVPAAYALVSLGGVFYREGPRPSVELRALYAGLARPVFCLIAAWFIISMVFKFENVYRRVLEWEGWGVWSRLSFCAYLLHYTVIKYLLGTTTVLTHITPPNTMVTTLGTVGLSLTLAIPLYLLVEAPALRLQKIFTESAKKNSIKLD